MIIKVIIIAIGAVIFLMFSLPLVTTKLNIGNILGIAFGLGLIICGATLNKIITLCQNTTIKCIVIAMLILISIALIILFVALYKIIKASKPSATNQTTVIVLGCRVKGYKASTALTIRCKAAYEYLKSHPNAVAIISGGQGAGEKISEAKCGYDLLVNSGIEPNRLIMEDKSTSTDENIRFSKAIIESKNLSTDVAIATSEYHQLRAKMICTKYNLKSSSIPSSTVKLTRPPIFVREAIAVIYMYLKNGSKR